MENLLQAVKVFKEKRQDTAKPSLESLKAAYTELLQRHKALEAYLDDNSISREAREAKIGEFKAIVRRLDQFLVDIAKMGHQLQHEEIMNGFE